MTVADESGLRGLSVLVVEDDLDCLELVVRLLTARNADVIATSSASEALAAFVERRLDVIVSDIGMAGMDGYRFLEEVRRIEDARGIVWTPAIALTAFATTSDMRQAGRAGYQRHLSKPFEPEDLVRAIAEMSGRRPRKAVEA